LSNTLISRPSQCCPVGRSQSKFLLVQGFCAVLSPPSTVCARPLVKGEFAHARSFIHTFHSKIMESCTLEPQSHNYLPQIPPPMLNLVCGACAPSSHPPRLTAYQRTGNSSRRFHACTHAPCHTALLTLTRSVACRLARSRVYFDSGPPSETTAVGG